MLSSKSFSLLRTCIIPAVMMALLLHVNNTAGQTHDGGKGFWKLSHVITDAFETRQLGDKDENGISQPGYTDDQIITVYLSGKEGNLLYNYKWGQRGWSYTYKANLTWGLPPEILVPGQEYSIPLMAAMLECNRPINSKTGKEHYPRDMTAKLQAGTTAYSQASVEDLNLSNFLTGYPVEGTSFDYHYGAYLEVFSTLEDYETNKKKEKTEDKSLFRFIPIEPAMNFGKFIEVNGVWQEVFEKPERQEFAVLIAAHDKPNGSAGKYFAYIYEWHDGSPPVTPVSSEPLYSINITQDRREVTPDGRSTIEITATLYQYTEGDDASAKALAGKRLEFEIGVQYGITPGTLSAPSLDTDFNGQVKVTYTAPKGEMLSKTGRLINSATVKINSPDYNTEEIAYIRFSSPRGEVNVEPPIAGIFSTHGIVPPDGRFPARISARIENSSLEALPMTEVSVTLAGEKTYGSLRDPDGNEGKTLQLISDEKGMVVFFYFFASDQLPDGPVTENIEIRTRDMVMPLRAQVSVGLNLVFESVESAYEGRGIVNAGEEIPLRVKIKDAWNPQIDLSEILTYWGLGHGTGDTRLYARLEMDNVSSIPDYLLDHMRQQRFPEPSFSELMQVRTFRDKKQLNMLWIPESSLKTYGYPRIRPSASGNHYYEARISLVDSHGKIVQQQRHPGSKALFNLQTGMSADALYIFFVTNPLRPQTPEAEVLAIALDLLGMGALISVVDAMDAINRGDTDALFDIMFSEIKGFFIDQAKERSPDFTKAMDAYSRISAAQKITEGITQGMSGPMVQNESQWLARLSINAQNGKEQLIVLTGRGEQKLIVRAEGEQAGRNSGKEGINLLKGLVNINLSGIDEKTRENIGKIFTRNDKGSFEVPAVENQLYHDKAKGITSLKKGSKSYYIIPEGYEITFENADDIRKY